MVTQSAQRRVDDAAFWVSLGATGEPSMRDKIILLTYEAVAKLGPAAFNVKDVCDELGIAYSLINHHFGSRDALLAETAVRAYETYIGVLWAAAQREKKPKARLRAWLEAQIEWSKSASGWGALLNYPTTSLGVANLIDEHWGARMIELGQFNLARLYQLVYDVKKNKVTPDYLELGRIPIIKMMANTRLLYLMSSIGWSILGVSVWSAGRHLPTGNSTEAKMHERMAVRNHLDRIINQIRAEEDIDDLDLTQPH